MTLPTKVRLVEVGPRDGLQNEPQLLGTELKVELIAALGRAGLRTIEATSFVSPKWIPQMADNAAVMARIVRLPGVSYPVLTPNLKGFKAALAAGATEVAVFAAASESFSQRNINCSIAESLGRFEPLMQAAIDAGVQTPPPPSAAPTVAPPSSPTPRPPSADPSPPPKQPPPPAPRPPKE